MNHANHVNDHDQEPGAVPQGKPPAHGSGRLPCVRRSRGPAFAGTDTTFDTAFTKFTAFLEGSGGKIITIISLALGLVGMASGRFSLGQIALPVGVGIGVGTGFRSSRRP